MPRTRDARAAITPTTPYVELDRSAWSRLAAQTPLPLSADEVERLRGLSDEIDLTEVREVYLPLTRLLNLYVRGTGALHRATQTFLAGEANGAGGRRPRGRRSSSASPAPSPSARAPSPGCSANCSPAGPNTLASSLVTTDGFLLPNAELERRGLLQRKGFPESYDQRALLRFIVEVKSGLPVVAAPVYSHLEYDIVPDGSSRCARPTSCSSKGSTSSRRRGSAATAGADSP